MCLFILIFLLIFFVIVKVYILFISKRHRKQFLKNNLSGKIIGFFHPYCNAGGGGERVLWCAIRALQKKYPKYVFVVYTGDKSKPDEIVNRVETNFKISLLSPIEFVYLNRRNWVEASRYPCLTLLGQSLGSIWLGFEAMTKCVPDVYIDSMGYSFTLPLFKYLTGCRVATYTHYPTISTDMIDLISQAKINFNNKSFISNNRFLTKGKLIYYRIFAFIYGLMGSVSEVVMVNSSWTKDHINRIWKCPNKTYLVYPPCCVDEFKKLDFNNRKKFQIVSISQFRPEKNHALQLEAFRKFIDRLKPHYLSEAKLFLIGSCRNKGDEERVNKLKEIAKSLEIEKYVEFKINILFEELLGFMRESNIGLHTMTNEHFGIGVVECMASGLITVAHDSAGPKMDIITNNVDGFLATDSDSFADTLYKITEMDESQLNTVRENARESVERFSEQNFEDQFLKVVKNIL